MNIPYYPDVFTVFLVTAIVAGLVRNDFRQVSLFLFVCSFFYYVLRSAMKHVDTFQFLEPIAVYLIAGLAWTIILVFLEMLSWKLEWKSKVFVNWIDQEKFSRSYATTDAKNYFLPHISLAFKYWNNEISKEELFAAIDRSSNPIFSLEEKEEFLNNSAKIIADVENSQEIEKFLELYANNGFLSVEVNKRKLGQAILANIVTYPYVLVRIVFRSVKACIKIAFLSYTRQYLQQIEKASKVSNMKTWFQEK